MDYRVYDKMNKRYMGVVQVCFPNERCAPQYRAGVLGVCGLFTVDYLFVDWKDAVLEQSTGMEDANGQVIFEGHVVRGIESWDSWDHLGVVEYHKGLGAFVLNLPGNTDVHRIVELATYDKLEILGNYTPAPAAFNLKMRFFGDEEYREREDA